VPQYLYRVYIIALLIGKLLDYNKVRSDFMKECTNRQIILCYINEFPGVHFSNIVRELRLSHGLVTYHTRKLEKEEIIKHYLIGCKKCFFPSEYVINLTSPFSN